jgi:hypothetical protein
MTDDVGHLGPTAGACAAGAETHDNSLSDLGAHLMSVHHGDQCQNTWLDA